MMGLLDFRFSQDPEKEAAIRRGLLDFGLNMMAQGGKSTGQAIGNSGLLSLQANQQREGSAQRAALHKAQMDEYKAQAGQRTAQTEEAQRKARRDEEFRRSLGGGTQSMQPDQAVSPGALTNWSAIGAPQGQQGATDYRALAASYPEKIEQIKALAEAGNFGRQEVARTLEEGTPTGGKQTVSFDKYGGRVGAPVSGYVPPQLVDLGDRKVFTTPKDGAEFRPGLSPSDLTSRRGQDIGAATARLGREQSDRHFNTTQGAGKWQYDAERGVRVNPQTGEAESVTKGGAPLGAKDKPLNDAQAKALLFSERMAAADAVLVGMAAKGVDTPSVTKMVADAAPRALGGGVASAAANKFAASPEQQKVEQAQRDFINAVLRRESGAVITEPEFENARKQYFPALGDSAEVKKQKAENRQLARTLISAEVPPAYARPARSGGGSGDKAGDLSTQERARLEELRKRFAK